MTTSYRRESLSIDPQLALRTAATNLQRRFDETFGGETIERFLHSSFISGDYPKPWPDDVMHPAGLDLVGVRPVRDEVEPRVRGQLDEMHVPAHA